MRATMAAVAALAGGLFLLATAHGPASATSVPINLKNVIGTTPGSVELVRQGGGGGGGGHGGGGGRYSGGGGGGGGAAIRGGGGGGPRVGAGPRGGGNFANRSGGRNYSGQRSYAGRNIDRSGPRASRDYGGDRGRYADRNRGDHRRYAERGRDNNHNNHKIVIASGATARGCGSTAPTITMTTTPMAAIAIGCASRLMPPAAPIGGRAITPASVTTNPRSTI